MNPLASLFDYLRGKRPPGALSNPPRYAYSYKVYWLKTARQWERARRQAVAEAVSAVLAQPDFSAQEQDVARVYTVRGLDEQAHSGASLRALREVLDALEAE